MKTCKDCIHYDVCAYHITEESDMTVQECALGFKDKSLIMELPCPIGSKIYMIVTKRPKVSMAPFSFIKATKLTYNNLERVLHDIGKEVFLTREEVEKAFTVKEVFNR